MTEPHPGTAATLSVNTATLGHREPIGAVIERLARHGFGGIAPWRRDLEGHSAAAVARQIREAGLQVTGYCRSSYIPRPTGEEREAAFAENCRAIADAAELGAACFVLVVGGLPAGSRDLVDARRQVHDGIDRLLVHARSCGVKLAVEPLHPMYAADRSCVTSLAEALDLCRRLDPDRSRGLGVAIDAYHVWWDWRLADGIREAGQENRILAFHICDWRRETRDMLLDRGLMGEGAIDLVTLERMVRSTGFAGLAEIEIFSDELWRADPDEVLSRCIRQWAASARAA